MAWSTTKRKRFFYGTIILIITLSVSAFFANKYVKTKGYKNLWDFFTTTSGNYSQSLSAEYEEIEIKIDDEDFKKLEQIRQESLERGLIVNEDDSYVPAVIKHNGKKIKCEVRLKGHMTDHVQDKKWSFRVKTKKGDAFMGMQRFSLQHPGTRAYINEWIYHKMMEREGIMALRYQFLNVSVNGEDWGIYALEEHFAQELVEHNDRMKGPIIRYNPELYWVFRENEKNKLNVNMEYSGLQSSYFEPYETKYTLSDSTLRRLFINAMNRLEGFRRGDLTCSEVFDIEKLAKFHAIVDLVGGHHSLDWSDVKYYYNKETQLLEPVAYESFSIRPVTTISGSYRFSGENSGYINDHHNALFNDTAFYREYIHQVERICTDSWLDALLESIDPELQSNLAILYKEFPYKNYDPKPYYDNIKSIRAIVSTPKGIYANLESSGKKFVELSIGGIESLPFVIDQVEIDKEKFPLDTLIYVPCKNKVKPINFAYYKIELPDSIDYSIEKKIKLYYHLPGDTVEKIQEVFNYPSYDSGKNRDSYLREAPNVNQFPFLVVNAKENEIRCMPGKYIIKKTMVLPEGYRFIITEGTTFVIEDSAMIISYAVLDWKGTEEAPITFTSEDGTGQGIVLHSPKSNSEISFVIFENLSNPARGAIEHSSAFNVFNANVKFDHCSFRDIAATALNFVGSNIELQEVSLNEIENEGIRAYFSNMKLFNVEIKKVKDDGIFMKGSYAVMQGVKIKNCEGSALNITNFSGVKSSGVLKIEKAKCGIEAQDAAQINVQNLTIENCELGMKAHKKGDVYGYSGIIVQQYVAKGVKVEQEAEKGSTIKIGK